MICDKCEHEYDIGNKGEYRNTYGTRCPNCWHLIKPDQEPKFIENANAKRLELIEKYLPLIREKIAKEEKKNAD
jgi:hypothetical protein